MRDKYTRLFKKLCFAYAEESKDPETKVGAILVKGNQISGGYNGFPTEMLETEERWQRPEKYERVIHAEINTILNCPFDYRGSSLYCTHQPCKDCLMFIYQAGIKEVYFWKEYENLKRKDIWLEIAKKIKCVKL